MPQDCTVTRVTNMTVAMNYATASEQCVRQLAYWHRKMRKLTHMQTCMHMQRKRERLVNWEVCTLVRLECAAHHSLIRDSDNPMCDEV